MNEKTLHVIAHVVARSEEASQVRERFEALVAPTRAEPGCLSYELFVDERNPAEFVFVQEYESEAAFDAHLNSEHISRMLPAVLPLLSSPPDIRRYRRLSR